MSVISIRPSQERLRNLGDVRRPDRMPHFVPPNAKVADGSIVPRAVGGLVGSLQDAGGKMLSAYIRYRRSEDNILLAKAGAEYQKAMREGMLGADGSDGQPATPGLMSAKGVAVKTLGKAASDLETRVFNEVCDKNELDGRMKELLRMHVNPVTQSWANHVANHVFMETARLERATAESNSGESCESWQLSKYDPETAAKAISDFEYLRKVNGDTEELAVANVRKFTQGLAADIIRDRESSCAGEADFDSHIAQLKDPQRRVEFVRMNEAIYDELVGKPARKETDALVKEKKLAKDEAQRFLKERTGELEKSVFSPKTVELLIDAAKQRKDRFVLEQTRATNAEVESLIARGAMPEEKTVIQEMDDKILSLKDAAAKLPKDSRIGTAQLQAAAKLEKSADSLAGQQMLTDYLDRLKDDPDYRLYIAEERGADGKVTKEAQYAYPKDSRKGKLCEQVQAMFDRQMEPAHAARRKKNAEYFESSMPYKAANPAKFREEIFAAAKNGDITIGDYERLGAEFNSTWAKGYKAGEQSPMQLMAKDMIDAFREIFPDENLDSAFQWNERGMLLERTKDGEYGGFEYKPAGNWFFDEDVDADSVLQFLNAATKLARYDGEKLGFDPISQSTETDYFGQKVDKDATFNARNYFRQYLQRMKDGKEISKSSDALIKFARAERNIYNSLSDREEKRLSQLHEGEKKPRRTIQFRKPGAGTAAAD